MLEAEKIGFGGAQQLVRGGFSIKGFIFENFGMAGGPYRRNRHFHEIPLVNPYCFGRDS